MATRRKADVDDDFFGEPKVWPMRVLIACIALALVAAGAFIVRRFIGEPEGRRAGPTQIALIKQPPPPPPKPPDKPPPEPPKAKEEVKLPDPKPEPSPTNPSPPTRSRRRTSRSAWTPRAVPARTSSASSAAGAGATC